MSSNVSDRCQWFMDAGYYANVFHHDVHTPFQLIVGLTIQALLLISFYKQSKSKGAYWYQFQLVLSEFAVILTRGYLFISLYSLSGYHGRGVMWFMSSSVCMWFTVHFCVTIPNMMVTTSLLLTIAMSGDRVFAMAKPFVYKNIDHRKRRIVAGLICLVLGVATSMFDVFRFEMVWETEYYIIRPKESFILLPWAAALSSTRDFVRASGTVVLIGTNAAMLIYYRKYLQRVGQMANSTEIKRRREQEKVLTLLAVSESISNTLSMLSFILFYVMVYVKPDFTECEGYLFGPISDMVIDFSVASNCLLAFAVSRSFRKMVYDSIPPLKKRLVHAANQGSVDPESASYRTDRARTLNGRY